MLLIAKQSCHYYVEAGIETTQKEHSEVEIDHLLSINQALTSEQLNTGFSLTPPSIRLCVQHSRGHWRVFDYQKMPQKIKQKDER
jgi:hypothetical protein